MARVSCVYILIRKRKIFLSILMPSVICVHFSQLNVLIKAMNNLSLCFVLMFKLVKANQSYRHPIDKDERLLSVASVIDVSNVQVSNASNFLILRHLDDYFCFHLGLAISPNKFQKDRLENFNYLLPNPLSTYGTRTLSLCHLDKLQMYHKFALFFHRRRMVA